MPTLQDNRRSFIICIICFLVTLFCLMSMAVVIVNKDKSNNEPLVIDMVVLKSTFNESDHVPMGNAIMSEDEFNAAKGSMIFSTYEDYLSSATSYSTSTSTLTASGANAELFSYCDNYYKCYWGCQRISPLFPMALANAETPGRADFSVTWSSLFPSKYVDVSEIGTFDVTDVIRDNDIYTALSTEYSTRDRGALQMNPTYGTNNAYLNSLMSDSEKNKLSKVDTSGYESWVSGAAMQSGDRFYLPDVLLRMQAVTEVNITNIVKNDYEPSTDMQMLAMLAIAHNTGTGIWSYSNHDKKVGNWISGQKAFDLCARLGSSEFIEVLTGYADNSSATYIDTATAEKLYSSVYSDSYKDYTTSKTNFYYPVKVLYSYIKLAQLYTE